jgi:inorganic pyrophosphatase
MKTVPLSEFETIQSETGDINVIIETPRGSRNKFKYDSNDDLFILKKVLPAGAVFPREFGFIPSTAGQDGDPLDVLVLMDEPAYPGNLVRVRLIGAIEAEQTEDGKTLRNDRLIAVATECQDYHNVQELDDLDDTLLAELEYFFISYNEIEGKRFKPTGRSKAKQAKKLLEEGRKRFENQKNR